MNRNDRWQSGASELRFREWLAAPSWTEDELLRWCYIGNGRGRESRAPHEFLLSALPMDADRPPAVRSLATRVAQTLEAHPDLRLEHPGGEETVYSLLQVAAGLDSPAELARPLWQVREALRAGSGNEFPAWLRDALLQAITLNQVRRPEAHAIWRGMVLNQRDPVLGGTPEDGFRGLALMPGPNAGEPDRDAIGWALLQLAHRYAPDPDTRRQEFRARVYFVRDLWALKAWDLIFMADQAGWAEEDCTWAVDALPELCVFDFGQVTGGLHCALAWSWFCKCLIPYEKIDVQKSYCGGRVLQVCFSEAVSAEFCRTLREMERSRSPRAEISEKEANHRIAAKMNEISQLAVVRRLGLEKLVLQTRREFAQEATVTIAEPQCACA